jgi:membrane fusion protein (multidrug efflux system)
MLMLDTLGHQKITKINVMKELGKSFTIGIFALAVIACGKQEQENVTAPPPAVSVYKVVTDQIGSYREFVARTEASKTANLMAPNC